MNYYFITGSSRGIGKSLTINLLQRENSKVVGIARKDPGIFSENYEHISIDLSKPENLDNIHWNEYPDAEKLILINNAGVISQICRAEKLSSQAIIHDYNVNTIAAHLLISKFLKSYQHREIPRLIFNVSSGAARHPVDAWSIYCASKSAMDMMSLCMAREQEFYPLQQRVRIFSVAPGVIDTDMQTKIRNTPSDDFSSKQRFVDLKKNNELFSPEEVAEKLLYIIDNQSDFSEVLYDVRDINEK